MPQYTLPFKMQLQMQDNWCWAACAASISLFYNTASTWSSQCVLAITALNNLDCCLGVQPNPCDIPFYLDQALTITGNLSGGIIPQALTKSEISNQIDAGNVIAAGIKFPDVGPGHLVVIYGYDSTDPSFPLQIGDPSSLTGNVTTPFDEFTNHYLQTGVWTKSYYTTSILGKRVIPVTTNKNVIERAVMLKNEYTNTKTPDIYKPHYVFNISLKSLKNGEPDITKAGFRILDPSDETLKDIYQFSDNSADAKLQQVLHTSPSGKKYEEILVKLSNTQKNIENGVTLRTIRQPELKVEAFWLHDEGEVGNDIFEPVISLSFLKAGRSYNEEEFFAILSNAAKKRETYSDDQLND